MTKTALPSELKKIVDSAIHINGRSDVGRVNMLRELLLSPAWMELIQPMFYRIRENIIQAGKKYRKDEKTVRMWAALEGADLVMDAPQQLLKALEQKGNTPPDPLKGMQ